MYNQLSLPINIFEPTDFSEIDKTPDNELAINWLTTWGSQNAIKINYTCLVGEYAPLFASIWSRTNDATVLPSDARLFKNWYKIIEKKHNNKCYTLNFPELIKDENMVLYILNLVKENNSYLLLTSDIHPRDWCIELPDLKSRISTINVFTC